MPGVGDELRLGGFEPSLPVALRPRHLERAESGEPAKGGGVHRGEREKRKTKSRKSREKMVI